MGSTTGDGVVRVALGCFPLAIQYPGRHDRRKEPFVDQISVMIESIGGELVNSVADKRFALFGRSVGAVFAVAVGRKLDPEHRLTPELLHASGRHAPTHPSWLSDPESLPEFSPIARDDYRAIENYTYSAGVPTTCPTTTFVGRDDPYLGRGSRSVGCAHAGPFYCTQAEVVTLLPGTIIRRSQR